MINTKFWSKIYCATVLITVAATFAVAVPVRNRMEVFDKTHSENLIDNKIFAADELNESDVVQGDTKYDDDRICGECTVIVAHDIELKNVVYRTTSDVNGNFQLHLENGVYWLYAANPEGNYEVRTQITLTQGKLSSGKSNLRLTHIKPNSKNNRQKDKSKPDTCIESDDSVKEITKSFLQSPSESPDVTIREGEEWNEKEVETLNDDKIIINLGKPPDVLEY